MPKLSASLADAGVLQAVLDRRSDLNHLRVQRRGATLTLVSGAADDPVPHIRLVRQSATLWRVDMVTHSGRWQQTPFAGPLPDVVLSVAGAFGWALAPLDNPHPDPETTR